MKTLESPFVIAMFIIASVVILFAAGCSQSNPYVGPTVSTVGVTGSYSDRDGNTYGGGVQVGLNPPPTPAAKPVDRSK